MYSLLREFLILCETASGSEVSTGARLAVASEQFLSLVCDRVREGLRVYFLSVLFKI